MVLVFSVIHIFLAGLTSSCRLLPLPDFSLCFHKIQFPLPKQERVVTSLLAWSCFFRGSVTPLRSGQSTKLRSALLLTNSTSVLYGLRVSFLLLFLALRLWTWSLRIQKSASAEPENKESPHYWMLRSPTDPHPLPGLVRGISCSVSSHLSSECIGTCLSGASHVKTRENNIALSVGESWIWCHIVFMCKHHVVYPVLC